MTDDGQRALMPALSADLLDDSIDGEPRMRDLDVARALGLKKERDIRSMIADNREELESHGLLPAETAIITFGKGGQRQVEEYWLNEGQALTLAFHARTPAAAAVRKQILDVFMAWRRGEAADIGRLREMLLKKDPRWVKLLQCRRAGLSLREIARVLQCHRDTVRELYREMVDCGIIVPTKYRALSVRGRPGQPEATTMEG